MSASRDRGAAFDPRLVGSVLVILLLLTIFISAVIGAYQVSVGDVVGAILRRIGILSGEANDPIADELIWFIRLPRIVLGVLVGACLAMAGAVMQGAFANPLSEPGIVGVSSGAMAGAALQIVTGFSPLGIWTLPVAAFLGGLAAVAIVYATARHDGRTETLTLILMGVALNALAGAIIGLLAFVADDASLRSLTSWTLGSLAQSTWEKVWIVAPAALLGMIGAFSLRRAREPGHPCPPAASRTNSVTAPPARAAWVVVVTVPSTAAFPSGSDAFAFTQKSTTSRTGLNGADCALRTTGFSLMPPASGTSPSLAPLITRIGSGTFGTVSNVNMLATTGAAAASRSGRFTA